MCFFFWILHFVLSSLKFSCLQPSPTKNHHQKKANKKQVKHKPFENVLNKQTNKSLHLVHNSYGSIHFVLSSRRQKFLLKLQCFLKNGFMLHPNKLAYTQPNTHTYTYHHTLHTNNYTPSHTHHRIQHTITHKQSHTITHTNHHKLAYTQPNTHHHTPLHNPQNTKGKTSARYHYHG